VFQQHLAEAYLIKQGLKHNMRCNYMIFLVILDEQDLNRVEVLQEYGIVIGGALEEIKVSDVDKIKFEKILGYDGIYEKEDAEDMLKGYFDDDIVFFIDNGCE
ncbi:MAG: hypothetical protein U1C19_11775, partial [Methanobacteriaceae archaeon]|nr:hypothetical protein [Methanobacteriaceae archaeon]